jgi:rod shape-determining protein MreC
MRGRNSPFKPRPRRSWRAPGEVLNFSLYFLCAVLLIMSRIGHDAVLSVRDRFVDFTAPVLEAASVPAIMGRHAMDRARSYIGLAEEIDRLKAENQQLKQWEWRAKLLERNVAHLRSLLNAVDEPALHYVTGSVIADARGPFLRSALINLGRNQGVRIGYAVINGDGLIGRTVDAGASVSRVLLLNDLNSRIPVLVGPGGVRALASGDNGAELRLDFLPDEAVLYPGDEVYTSGSDGVLPRGLRVGVVTGSPGAFKARPYAKLGALDWVSVLYFDTPALMRTDPPAISAERALSPPADGTEEPPPGVPAASHAPVPASAPIKHAGAAADSPPAGDGVAQSQQ